MTRNQNEIALLLERIFIDVQPINEESAEIWVNEHHFATVGKTVWNVVYIKPWELDFERGNDFPEEAAARLRDCILDKNTLCEALKKFVKLKNEQKTLGVTRDFVDS